MPAGLRRYEQVVEDQNPRQGARGKAGIKLGESDGGIVSKGEKDDGLLVHKPLSQELPRAFGIAREAVEPAVGVEERDDEVEVLDGGLANREGLRMHQCSSYEARMPAAVR